MLSDYDAQKRVQDMVQLIEAETQERQETILAEAAQKQESEKNRIFGRLRESLYNEFRKNEETEEVRVRTFVFFIK